MKNQLVCSCFIGLLLLSNPSFSADSPSLNVYGRIHLRLITEEDQRTSLNNAGHRLGMKGEGKLNNGLGFFYKLETEYGNDSAYGKKDGLGGNTNTTSSDGSTDLADIKVRHANVGLSGNLLSVIAGRQGNPLTGTYTADVFQTNSGVYEQAPYRIGHALVVKSAAFSGLDAYGGALLEGGTSDSQNEQDLTGGFVGGSFTWGALTLKGGYMSYDSRFKQPDDATTPAVNELINTKTQFDDWSVGLSYSILNVYLGANIESSRVDVDGTKTDTDVVDLAVTYTQGSTIYGLGYAMAEVGSLTKTRIVLGAYHTLGGGNDCYIETGQYNKDDGSGDNLVLGYRVKF